MLVPARLAVTAPPHCIVSLFLHSPFPSPEVWRVLPWRKELLQGMLGAHVVGYALIGPAC